MLTIPDTERLRFIVGKTSYDDLFKDIFHANDWYERMNAEIKQLTGDAWKAATAEYIRRMEADIQFIIHHVAPKDADPNVTILSMPKPWQAALLAASLSMVRPRSTLRSTFVF